MNPIKKVVSTFEEMIQNYYGGSATVELRPIDRYEAVIANYYGKPFQKKKCNKPPAGAPAAVAMSADDGELLPQAAANKSGCEEYVVQRSLGEPVFGDYIVDRGGDADATPTIGRPGLSDSASAAAECRVDVFQSQQVDAAPECCATNGAAASPCPPSPTPRAVTGSQPAVAQSLPSPTQKPAANASEEDFAADLQAILSGQQVYDPREKKVVPREQLSQQSSNGGESPRPSLDAPNPHAIFDQIAERMKYANTFDLGEVKLQKRFEEFDALRDLEAKDKVKDKNKKKDKTIAPAQAASESVIKPDTGDFIHDLDAIRDQHSAAASDSITEAASLDSAQYSKPLFDTGEHVLIAEDVWKNMLRVGKDPGVPFSYGQIVAMADMYESVEEMMSAEPGELQKLKALIERSTNYYKGGKKRKELDVSDDEWDGARGGLGRFLDLAAANFEHFSPNFFFPSAPFAGSVHQHGTNKSAWEAHHQRAIEEVHRIQAAHPAGASALLDYPLIINAFGDHFLTDAFAAGHSTNKEEMMAIFKSNFFNGGSLNPNGKKFFEKLARAAFRGQVAKKFSELETVANYGPCLWGWCLSYHPTIRKWERFRDMLTAAAEQQPDEVGNFAVKALHDKLNEVGVEVTNDAGDRWTITGDGYLKQDNRAIIRKAVLQSADNIISFDDPSIAAGNINFPMYFASVWKYVPRPTEAAKQRIIALANDYLSPTSDHLVVAAADLITKKCDTLIKKLVNEKKLRAA